MKCCTLILAIPALTVALAMAAAAGDNRTALDDPSFFPIAVWLQDPSRAPAYKEIGINVYVGLWKGQEARHACRVRSERRRAAAQG
jgi:hypothetical protein